MAYNPKLYWEKRLSNSFDLEAVGFDSFGKGFNKWLYKMAGKSLENTITDGLIKPYNKSVLDIGCGTGFYINVWRKYIVRELAGIDIAESSIKNLKEKYPSHKFYQVDIGSQELNMPLQTYDIVTAFAVLFHIIEDVRFNQAIKNISNLCDRYGVVLITDIFPHKRPYILPHQKSRTLDEYTRILSNNGLKITYRTPVHYFLNAPLDIDNQLMQKVALQIWWKYIVGGLELTTHSLGALFYGLDSILKKVYRESPTTEMIICQKI